MIYKAIFTTAKGVIERQAAFSHKADAEAFIDVMQDQHERVVLEDETSSVVYK